MYKINKNQRIFTADGRIKGKKAERETKGMGRNRFRVIKNGLTYYLEFRD